MRILFALLLLVALVSAHRSPHKEDGGKAVPAFHNETLSKFFSAQRPDGKIVSDFAIRLPRPRGPYFFQLELTFASTSEQFVVFFDEAPSPADNPTIISKEKAVSAAFVLQSEQTGAVAGWRSNALDCGFLTGRIVSDVRPVSMKAALRFAGKPEKVRLGSCFHTLPAQTVVPLLILLVLLALAAFLCCCCFCLCLRRCCARVRARCARRCGKNSQCAASKQCQEPAKAAEPAAAEAQQFLVPEEAQAYFVPIPVEANQNAQYVALVPMYPGNVQQV